MTSVEKRITGGDPHVTAARRLASQEEQGRKNWPLENPGSRIVDAYPRLFSPLASVRFNPFTGDLHLATYVPDRQNPGASLKRWSRYAGLEELTGATAEVLSHYHSPDGDLVTTTQALVDFTQTKGALFREREVASDELDAFMHEATALLAQGGFRKPILPLKDKIRKQIVAGLGPDSLNRRNPLIARTRLASAVVKLCMLEQVQDKVAKKYLELFAYLLPDFDLEQEVAAGVLDELRDPHSQLQLLRTMGDDTEPPVKSAPWRGPLMQAYFGMFANGRRSIDPRFFEDNGSLLQRVKTGPIDSYKPELIAQLQQALEDGTNIYRASV